jgi:hypothetical protein
MSSRISIPPPKNNLKQPTSFQKPVFPPKTARGHVFGTPFFGSLEAHNILRILATTKLLKVRPRTMNIARPENSHKR